MMHQDFSDGLGLALNNPVAQGQVDSVGQELSKRAV